MDCYEISDTTVAEYHNKALIRKLSVESNCDKVNNINKVTLKISLLVSQGANMAPISTRFLITSSFLFFIGFHSMKD